MPLKHVLCRLWSNHTTLSSRHNLIGQDHRGVKPRIGPMLGFKRLGTAALTIAGIELLRRIHKGQFKLSGLRLEDRSTPSANRRVSQPQAFDLSVP
jgi:transposase-like protein